MGDPQLSTASVILTEDLKLTLAVAFGGKITSKQRETSQVKEVGGRGMVRGWGQNGSSSGHSQEQ